jgi:hypothetical protein
MVAGSARTSKGNEVVVLPYLQPWVNRFAFQGQHSEAAFVDASQRLMPNEALQRFDTEGKFARG